MAITSLQPQKMRVRFPPQAEARGFARKLLMSAESKKEIEIRNFTTFMNDEMKVIIATDRKMHITETDTPIQGVLAPMDDEGCFVVEVNVEQSRIPKEQAANYPSGICYRFVSEDPIVAPVVAPGVDDFILFWVSEDHAHAVDVLIDS